MNLDDPRALDLEYSCTLMGFLSFQPEPKHIAIFGLGGGSLPKFCHRYVPAALIEAVEINPQVPALRDEFQIPRDDERLTVLPGAGAARGHDSWVHRFARWKRDRSATTDEAILLETVAFVLF